MKRANVAEYMSRYLNLPDGDSNLIPTPLRNFVANVTQSNPLYIRETIDQLREHHIQVNETAGGVVKNVECKAQRGHQFCKVISLLFKKGINWWSDSTHFDFLLLFQAGGPLAPNIDAIRKLLDQKMLEAVEPPAVEARMNFVRAETIVQEITDDGKVRDIITQVKKSEAGPPLDDAAKEYNVHTIDEAPLNWAEFEHYQQIEDAEREKKRKLKSEAPLEQRVNSASDSLANRLPTFNALIDRALYRYLPERMKELAEKRNKPHIPWYYEQAFRRMQT
eukprot:Skav215624  [mRNA]  locus=scaffold620:13854:35818:- [translate_table: standard]